MNPYVFDTKEVNGQSLIHLMNIYFEQDIVGVEIGTGHAQTLCTWLQQCNKIKTIHTVDPYKPYQTFLKNPYNEEPSFIGDDKVVDYAELTANHNIKFSGFKDKVVIHKEDSLSVSKKFEDDSLDFIFLDGYSNYNEVETDLNAWYPKLKKGGLFSGHDWEVSIIQTIIHNFRKKNNIVNNLSAFDGVWVWKK
jgi:hypothetical protein